MKGSNWTAVLVALAAFMSFSQIRAQTSAQAPAAGTWQGPEGGGISREERPRDLGQELKLSDQQRTNVLAVFEQMRQKMEAVAQELGSNADQQLQRILTPEQYQKLQALSSLRERQSDSGLSPTNRINKIRQ